jgi:hypothetical protein
MPAAAFLFAFRRRDARDERASRVVPHAAQATDAALAAARRWS